MSRCKCGTVSDKSICCDVNVASLTLKYSQCTVWCTVFSPRSSLSPPTHPVMILSFISGDAKAKLRDESAADISLISGHSRDSSQKTVGLKEVARKTKVHRGVLRKAVVFKEKEVALLDNLLVCFRL